MIGERGTVLARGPAGLRVSGWLARRGVAVRHLGLGPHAVEPRWRSAVAGERSILQPWIGRVIDATPRRGILHRGRLHELSGRRRDLARLGGGGVVGLARDLRPRVGAPDTLGGWARAQLGRAAWDGVLSPLLAKVFGGSVDPLPADLAALLVGSAGARWWAVDADAPAVTAAAVEAILAAGGEALEDVAVDALEVEGNRVVAAMAEFGREAVDEALFTDLSPAEVCALLPAGTVPSDEVEALGALAATDTVLVAVRADVTHLPWEVWIADPDAPGLRVFRAFGRSGEPRPDRVWVELVDRGTSDDEARDEAVAALGPLARCRDEGSAVERVPGAFPRPATAPEAVRGLARLRALGVVPVGARANHLPLALQHEAQLAAAWAAARSPGDALAELLTVPRSARGRALLP